MFQSLFHLQIDQVATHGSHRDHVDKVTTIMHLSEAISSASRLSTNQSTIVSCKEMCLVEN